MPKLPRGLGIRDYMKKFRLAPVMNQQLFYLHIVAGIPVDAIARAVPCSQKAMRKYLAGDWSIPPHVYFALGNMCSQVATGFHEAKAFYTRTNTKHIHMREALGYLSTYGYYLSGKNAEKMKWRSLREQTRKAGSGSTGSK